MSVLGWGPQVERDLSLSWTVGLGFWWLEKGKALAKLWPHQYLGLLVCPSFDSEKAGDREVQRTMLELLNQLDGFQPNTQVKVSIVITD